MKRRINKWISELPYYLSMLAYLLYIVNYVLQATKELYKDMLVSVGELMLLALILEVPKYVKTNRRNKKIGLVGWTFYWFVMFSLAICCIGFIFAPIGTAMFYYSDKLFPIFMVLYTWHTITKNNSDKSKEERGNEE